MFSHIERRNELDVAGHGTERLAKARPAVGGGRPADADHDPQRSVLDRRVDELACAA